ncbi:MAG: TetR/AcrR family transcriptional regulator [Longimicrobiales bacterium]
MDVRQRILNAAATLFASTGYRGTTTRRIAQEAGVNEVTLFRHFGSKDELILEAIGCYGWTGDVLRLPEEPADARSELVAWARGHVGHLRRVRSMIRTCLGESEERPEIMLRVKEGPVRTRDEVRRYLERLRTAGLASADVNVDGAAAMFLGALFTDVLSRDLMPELYQYPEDDAAAVYVDLLLRALGAANGSGAISSNPPVEHGQES